MKKKLALLLAVVLVVSMFPLTTFAAATEPNVTLSVDKTAVSVGDTITVKLGITEMNASSLAIGFDFDNTMLEVSSITAKRSAKLDYNDYDPDADEWFDDELGCTTISTKAEANNSGHVGAVWANDHEVLYYEKEAVVTIKFTALKDGTVKFEMFEDSAGTDGYKGEWVDEEKNITIGGSEPECEHTNTKAVSNSNGTHNFVCTNTECGVTVTENVPCAGGNATCTEAAKCADCGYEYKAALGHKDENKDHDCDNNGCGVPQGTHADGDDDNHTCDYCGGTVEGETHTEGEPVVNTEESTDATCTEGGTLVEDIFCTECGEFIRSIRTPVDATCTTGTVDYTWGDNNATCKAQLICEHGTVLKEEEVTTTYAVTTTGDCQTAEVVTYYADFSDAWTDQSVEVTGEKNMNNHAGTLTTSYTNNGENHTKTVTCSCGGTVSTKTEGHDFNNAHICDCTKVEEFTMTFDLNGGTLTDEYAYLEEYVLDGKYILPGVKYDASAKYKELYHEDVLVKEGYHISGFEDAEGGFHSLESDDIFVVKGDTTLTVIWEANEYTLTVNVIATGENVKLTVPYGANILEVLAQAVADGKIPALNEEILLEADRFKGVAIPTGYSYLDENDGWIYDLEGLTMPAGDFYIDQDWTNRGWEFEDDGSAMFYDYNGSYLTGWNYIEEDYDGVEGGAWYYFDEATCFRAEGLTRVPYPTTAINGITYAPDAEALASDPNFIDKDEAWFMFGEDGKFKYGSNGYTNNNGNEGKLVNGMLAWHPGMVEVTEDVYCYFIGDAVNGGNVMATGDVYVMRNTTDRAFVIGGVYTFGADGKLCEYDGITDMTNGTKRYYEDAQLMIGNGLTKVGDKFIYVRSNGELVVNADYYVPANTLGVVPGTYAFDANGYLVQPEMTSKDGIYYENGAWYYYENGKIGYNKGLMKVTATWYTGEGPMTFVDVIIYVRSNGQLATGTYYVTNLANYSGDDITSGMKLFFGNFGTAYLRNGIVNGYYYVDNKIAYGAGLIETDDGYIYVRSNGQVVMGTSYWITKVNDTGVVAKLYTFDDNGILLNPEFVADAKNGIVDGYYYENGNIVYGAGLIEYNGGIIYVRSNGKVATGKYWVTNTNGLLEAGYYTFGEDGMMIN